jgi:hypothetical protein
LKAIAIRTLRGYDAGMNQHTAPRPAATRPTVATLVGRTAPGRRAGVVPVEALERRSLLSATVTTISAPAATVLGQTFTVTATVVDATGAPVTSGTVDLFNNGATTGLGAPVNGSGVVTFTFGAGNALYAGSYGLSAGYLGTTAEGASTSAAAGLTISLPTFTTSGDGLQVATVTPGSGAGAVADQNLTVEYTGFYTSSGAEFDESAAHAPADFTYTLDATPEQVITGFDEGTVGIEPGETRVIVIPSALGYLDGMVRTFVIQDLAAGQAGVTAAELAVTAAPPTVATGAAVSTPVVVDVDDADGNLVGGDASSVTLAIASGPAGATLGGTTAVADAGGQASFGNLTFSLPGTYTLVATDGSLASDLSPPITVGGSSASPTPSPTPSPLVPTLGKVTLPATAVVGGKVVAHVSVAVTNGASSAFKGPVTVNVYAEAGTVLDGHQVLLATAMAKSVPLKGGKGRAFALPIRSLPSTLPAGTYHLIAEVVDPSGDTNVVATTQTITAAAPFVEPTVTVGAVAPSTLAAGKSGTVVVKVTNAGNVTATGVALTLAASADGATAVAGPALATLASSAKIAAGKSVTFRLHVKPSTASLAAGPYFTDVTVTLDGVSTTVVGGSFTVG